MNTVGKTNAEIFDELQDKMSRVEKITLDDLYECISTRSVVDPIAGENAVTIFYSGESSKFVTAVSDKEGANVRMIKRTEAFEFVNSVDFEDIVEYIVQKEHKDDGWTKTQIDDMVSHLFNDPSYDKNGKIVEGKGFWTIVSRKFAEETKGRSYCLGATAKPDRIYAMDELRVWMQKANDTDVMGGYTKAELSGMTLKEQFEVIKNWTIEDMQASKVFFDGEGKKIWQTFEGTSLEKVITSPPPAEYAYETMMKHVLQYRNIDDISVEYGIKTELTKLEQIMLQDIDARYRSDSTTVLSDIDLVAKHSFLENCSKTDLNTYRAYEYLKVLLKLILYMQVQVIIRWKALVAMILYMSSWFLIDDVVLC